MNRFLLSFVLVVISLTTIYSQTQTISFGAGYANDVFYSMKNDLVKTAARNTWDIGFTTSKMSSSLLVNSGAGAMLFSYPNGDTSAWNTLDTNGISNWNPMYDSEISWEEGAFGLYATGHPDYGWGVYNMITHNLTGDSLFVIKTVSGAYMKLWIQGKESAAGIYHFRFANLDGSNEFTETLNTNSYMDKNFLYYNLSSKQIVDHEPISADWDIMFTKYMAEQPSGGYYPVTGVLSNYGVEIARIEGVDTSLTNWADFSFSDEKAVIGWDWKSFSMTTMSYQCEDSLVFFVKNLDGDIYKLIFTDFAGSSTGNVSFTKTKLSSVGIGEIFENNLRIYPNPVSDYLMIETGLEAEYQFEIFDLAGKLQISESASKAINKIDVQNLNSGIYFIRILTEQNIIKTQKFIVK